MESWGARGMEELVFFFPERERDKEEDARLQ
jgi:hypothetical protein